MRHRRDRGHRRPKGTQGAQGDTGDTCVPCVLCGFHFCTGRSWGAGSNLGLATSNLFLFCFFIFDFFSFIVFLPFDLFPSVLTADPL